MTDDEDRDASLDRDGQPIKNSLLASPSQVFSRLGQSTNNLLFQDDSQNTIVTTKSVALLKDVMYKPPKPYVPTPLEVMKKKNPKA